MYNLFLDDLRQPKQDEVPWIKLPDVEWVVVKNYKQFTNYIQANGVPEMLFADHDLGLCDYEDPEERKADEIFEERNGLDCIKWLINYCLERQFQMPQCHIHSCNPVGRDNMLGILKSFKKARPELCTNL